MYATAVLLLIPMNKNIRFKVTKKCFLYFDVQVTVHRNKFL